MTLIRPTLPADAEAIRRLAAEEPLFNAAEVACVAELLQDYLDRPDHNGYFFLTLEVEDRIAGFACYGPTPLTEGTFDLYWILVQRERAGQGLGKGLMDRVEREVAEQGGRLLVVETSGRPDYAPTRAFYERRGYQPTATIPDFYAPGDDLVIYTTRLSTA